MTWSLKEFVYPSQKYGGKQPMDEEQPPIDKAVPPAEPETPPKPQTTWSIKEWVYPSKQSTTDPTRQNSTNVEQPKSKRSEEQHQVGSEEQHESGSSWGLGSWMKQSKPTVVHKEEEQAPPQPKPPTIVEEKVGYGEHIVIKRGDTVKFPEDMPVSDRVLFFMNEFKKEYFRIPTKKPIEKEQDLLVAADFEEAQEKPLSLRVSERCLASGFAGALGGGVLALFKQGHVWTYMVHVGANFFAFSLVYFGYFEGIRYYLRDTNYVWDSLQGHAISGALAGATFTSVLGSPVKMAQGALIFGSLGALGFLTYEGYFEWKAKKKLAIIEHYEQMERQRQQQQR